MKAAVQRITTNLQLDLENPWPGLDSYDEASREFFSGRSAETEELQRRIFDEPVTVLFGKSGLGKTSLLKAGVFPRLRQRNLLPILIRLQIRRGAPPLFEQVRLALFDELRAQGIDHADPAPGETLWEYLHRTGQEFWTLENRLVRPVFVFDQFEELFTLGRAVPAQVAAFRDDLADLAENRVPAAVARRIEERPANELGLDLQAMPYKVVTSLREDFLADFEEWRLTMPSLRRNRMRLLPMGPDQARQAIFNERTKHLVPELLADKIVTFLSSAAGRGEVDASFESGSVDPALLSLFCRGVNEHRKRSVPRKEQFDEAMIEAGKGTILTDFYRTSLADQPRRVWKFIEDELVTEQGFRNSYSVDDAVANRFITRDELTVLINRHILRHEHHLGTERVELTHDLLTKAIVKERDRRRERRLWLKLGTVAAVFAIVAIVLGGIAKVQRDARYQAETANTEALKATEKAVAALKAEKEQRDIADNALKDARTQAQIADREKNRANAERDRSRSMELGADAAENMDKNPELAILLTLEALKRADTEKSRSALLDAAQYVWPAAALAQEQLHGTPAAIALSPDGSRLAALAGSTTTVWDVTSRTPSLVWTQAGLSDPSSVAFSPDQKLLAIASKTAVDLFDVSTGRRERHLTQFDKTGDRRIGFSPDNRWLGSTRDGNGMQLLDYRDDHAAAVPIPAGDVGGFSILPGGNRIIAVSTNPLGIRALDRQTDGSWKSINLPSNCLSPQSISPGALYFSATLRATACIYRSDLASGVAGGSPTDRPTDDIVWSPAGSTFAEFVAGDVIVGTADENGARSGSRIKGAHPSQNDNEKSRLISVSESGARVALIDEEESVRVYSLADFKPFLSRFEKNSFAVSPDGRWMAAIRRLAPPEKPSTVVDVIPLDQYFASSRRYGFRATIPLDAPADELHVTQDSVVAVLSGTPAITGVFDAMSGRPRFNPPVGALPIGKTAELLFVPAADGKPQRLIKTRDGAPVSSWDSSMLVILSPNRQALAVMPAQARSPEQVNVSVYLVQQDRIQLSGQVSGLPAFSIASLQVADDGRSLSERNRRPRTWPVTKAPGSASAPPVPEQNSATSPLGRFAWREGLEQGGTSKILEVVRRADNSVVKRFRSLDLQHEFSSDDHWIATWSKDGLQVLDLDRGEIVFGLNHQDVMSVDFLGKNTILSVGFEDAKEGVMLIPLDRALMERYAEWLVSRTLTEPERCMYGLGTEKCSKEVVTPRAQSGKEANH